MILSTVNNKEMINNIYDYVDAYLIGIKGFSNYMPYNIDIEEIDEILKLIKDKNIFISMNKLMHNNDIDKLIEILKILSTKNVEGILYDDLSLLQINDEYNLNLNLVYASIHLTTNSNICSFHYDNGAKYVFISPDITMDETNNIIKNSKLKTIVQVFGYVPLFTSKRKLLSNYFDNFNYDMKNSEYYIKEDKTEEKSLIYQNEIGTHIMSGTVMNVCDYTKDLECDYKYFSSFKIDDTDYINILKDYKNNSKVDISLYSYNFDYGFFFKETVSKVK